LELNKAQTWAPQEAHLDRRQRLADPKQRISQSIHNNLNGQWPSKQKVFHFFRRPARCTHADVPIRNRNEGGKCGTHPSAAGSPARGTRVLT